MSLGLRFRLGPLRWYIPIRSRRRARYWTHPGCAMHHTRPDTAERCAARMPVPVPRPGGMDDEWQEVLLFRPSTWGFPRLHAPAPGGRLQRELRTAGHITTAHTVRVVFFEEDDGTLSATVDEMPGLRATGDDKDELAENLAAAMEKYVGSGPRAAGDDRDELAENLAAAMEKYVGSGPQGG